MDTCETQPYQQLLGTFLFTILVFLFTTVMVFYTFVTVLRVVVLAVQAAIWAVYVGITELPLYPVYSCVTNRGQYSTEVHFKTLQEPTVDQRHQHLHLRLESDHMAAASIIEAAYAPVMANLAAVFPFGKVMAMTLLGAPPPTEGFVDVSARLLQQRAAIMNIYHRRCERNGQYIWPSDEVVPVCACVLVCVCMHTHVCRCVYNRACMCGMSGVCVCAVWCVMWLTLDYYCCHSNITQQNTHMRTHTRAHTHTHACMYTYRTMPTSSGR